MSCESTTEQIANRLELLHEALVFCSETHQTFKTAERILINQERGSLFDYSNYINGYVTGNQVRSLQVPIMVEQKIKKIAQATNLKYVTSIEIITI